MHSMMNGSNARLSRIPISRSPRPIPLNVRHSSPNPPAYNSSEIPAHAAAAFRYDRCDSPDINTATPGGYAYGNVDRVLSREINS